MGLARTFAALAAEAEAGGLAVIDAGGRILWCNAAFASLAGGTPADLEGTALTVRLPAVGPVLEQLRPGEHRGLVVTGPDERPLTLTVGPVPPGIGEGLRRVTVAPLERTGSTPVEAELLAQIPSAVVATDLDGIIQVFNPAAERLFGHPAAVVRGTTSLASLHEPADLAARAAELGAAHGLVIEPGFGVIAFAARRSGRPEESEWICVRRDGVSFPVGYKVAPRLDLRGAVAGYIVMAADISRRRQAEARRRDLDLRLRKIAALVPGLVFQLELRPEGTMGFPFVSEGVRETCRLSPVELLEDAGAFFEVIHPDDRGYVVGRLHASAARLERWSCEYRTAFADGTGGWLHASAVPEQQEDGTVLWSGFVTDITERKRAEQALEENRAFLQSIYTSVELGIFVIDVRPDGDFRYFESNRAHERTTGLSSERVKGLRPEDLRPMLSAETVAAFRANYRRCVEAGAPIEYEECVVGERGFQWFLTRLTPLRDADDRIVRLIGSSLDITARKTIELRLQSISDRLRLATEAGGLGIWEYDLTTQRVTGDERMHEHCGLPPGAFDGTRTGFLQLVHPADHARLAQELRSAVVERRRIETAFRIVRPDGEVCELRTCALAQSGEDGRSGRLVGVCWDITRERRAQAELVRARDEAAAATVAKSAFLANMSHEIRTPLNAVIGMSSLLLGAGLAPEQRELAETIRSSGNALLDILNDVLDYSKIESGRLELESAPFEPRACIDSALDLLAARAVEKRLDLLCRVDPSVPVSVIGDVTRLRQVLLNLLGNALKFTQKGEVLLEVWTAEAEAGSVRLSFAVRDTGIGIPESRRDRLFQGFSQVDPSTTRQFGGSGLGLAICKHLVELMGGRIWYEGVEGQGSTFRFEIEVGRTPAIEKLPGHLVGAVSQFAGRRALIFDGGATARRLLGQWAEWWGLAFEGVATAAEALAAVRDRPYDVLVVDLGTAGERFLAAWRELPAAAAVPVVLLTPLGARIPIGLGIAGGVAKPVKPAQLFALLMETLAARSSTTPPAPAPAAPGPAPELPGLRHPLTILLAEDNAVNQRVALLMLRRLGYDADIAGNGREAVVAIEKKAYDLVFMDLQMPEMDGMEATRVICARWPGGQRPRIVAMTANASTSDRDECFAAGMDDFLSKPVRSPELARVLAETPARVGASAAATG